MKTVSIMLLALAAISLAGCGTKQDQQIVTRDVNIEVPVPCDPGIDPKKRPELMTKDQVYAAIAGAVTFDDKLKIVTKQLLNYISWLPVVETGLSGCEAVPKK